jgi:hypothetical protein
MRFRFPSLLWMLTLLGCGRVNEIAAIDDAGTTSGGTAGTASGGNGGSGGSGSSGGTAGTGTGGTGATTAQDLTHYHGCELPTGAIRYGVYKTDPARDLCFQIVVSSTSVQFDDIQVSPEDFDVESAHVWQDASTCGNWPATETAVAAIGGSGTIEVSPILTSPPQLDVDVTLEFPPLRSWVPASEPVKPGKLLPLGYDCASCSERVSAYKTLLDQTRQAVSAGAGACTSLLRFDHETLELLAHAVQCGPFDAATESQALGTAQTGLGMAAGATLLSGSQADDQFVFRGTHATPFPEADGLGAAVSYPTGLLAFGVRMGWSSPGGVEVPTTWRPGSELGGGCPTPQLPSGARGYDLNQSTPLSPSEVDAVVAKAFSTAMPQGILDSWGLAGMDAVVLRYSPGLAFDATNAEYVILVNSQQIVVD